MQSAPHLQRLSSLAVGLLTATLLISCPKGERLRVAGVVLHGIDATGTIAAFAVEADGSVGSSSIAQVDFTGGRFELKVPAAKVIEGRVIVEVTNGTSVDPASGAEITLPVAPDSLRAVVVGLSKDTPVENVVVSGVSTVAALRFLNGTDAEASLSETASMFGLGSLFGDPPLVIGPEEFDDFGDDVMHARFAEAFRLGAIALSGDAGEIDVIDLASVLAGSPTADATTLDSDSVMTAIDEELLVQAGDSSSPTAGSGGTGAVLSCLDLVYSRGARTNPDQTAYDARISNQTLAPTGSPLALVIDSVSDPEILLLSDAGDPGSSGEIGVGSGVAVGETVLVPVRFENPDRRTFTFDSEVVGAPLPAPTAVGSELFLLFQAETPGSSGEIRRRARIENVGSTVINGPLRLDLRTSGDTLVVSAAGTPSDRAVLAVPGSESIAPGEVLDTLVVSFIAPAAPEFEADVLALASPASEGVLDYVALDVADLAGAQSGTSLLEFRLQNLSPFALASPVIAFGDLAPSTASLSSADGNLADCRPAVVLGDESIAPGRIAGPFVVEVSNPDASPLTFAAEVVAQLTIPEPDLAAPVISIEVPEVLPAVTAASPFTLVGRVDEAVSLLTVAGVPVEPDLAGRFQADVSLSEGENLISIQAEDLAGNPGFLEVTAILDTTPPQIGVISPASGTEISNDRVTVTGAANDERGVRKVSIRGVEAALGSTAGQQVVSFEVPVLLAPGPNEIRIAAEDGLGNRTEFALDVSRVSDSDQQGPVLSIESPVAGALLNTSEVVVEGRALDATGVVNLAVNGTVVQEVLQGERFQALVTLAEGPQTIEVSAEDPFRNRSSVTRQVTVDFTPPAAPIVTATEPPSPTRASSVKILGTSEPGSRVEVRGAALPAATTADPSGQYQIVAALRSGRRNGLELVATDSAGNRSGATLLAVVQDGVAPSLAIVSPADGDELIAGSLDVLVTAADANGLASVAVGGTVAESQGSDLFRATIDASTRGPRTLTASAVDSAGNLATRQIQVSIVPAEGDDTVGPVISILEPSREFVAGGSVAVIGTVRDESPIAGVQVLGATSPVDAVLSGQTFSATVDLASAGPTPIVVTASDTAGNDATASRTVTRDDDPPASPTLSAVSSPTSALRIVLAGTAEVGATVRVEGGAAPVESAVRSDGTYSALVDLQVDAANPIQLRARDEAGNTSAATERTVVQDSKPPVVQAVTPAPQDGPLASDTAVRIEFDEVVDPASLAAALRVRANGSTLPLQIDPEASGQTVLVSPTGGFPADAAIELTVSSAVVDLAGNPLASSRTFRYAGNDTLAPSTPVLAAVPSRTSSDRIRLSGTAEPRARIEVSGGAGLVETTASFNGTFAVDVPLTINAANALGVVAIDAASNRSAPATAEVVQDRQPPVPVFQPAGGSGGVARTVTPQVRFGEPIVLQSLTGRVVLRLDGQAVPGRLSLPSSDPVGVFLPDAPLAEGRTYELALLPGVVDSVGNATQSAITSSFTVASQVVVLPPELDPFAGLTRETALSLSGSAAPGLEVVARNGATGGGEVVAPVDAGGRFALSVALAADTAQTIELRARVPGGAESTVVPLTVTQDGTPPTVKEISPAAGSTAAIGTSIAIRFSEPVVAGVEALLEVTDSGGQAVAGKTSLVNGGLRLTFIPSASLDPETSYSVGLPAGYADPAGNTASSSFAAAFVTAADTRRPLAPSLSGVPKLTRERTITVRGTVTAGDRVELTGGASSVAPVAATSGSFEFQVELRPNTTNRLTVKAVNPANGLSASTVASVEQDETPPDLGVVAPAEGVVLADPRVVVSGTVDGDGSGTTVTLNGNAVAVSAGRFEAAVQLVEGPNEIDVVATDAAGNTASQSVSVSFDPTAEGEPDIRPPVVAITRPLAGAVVGSQTLVTGTISDESPIVSLQVNGQLAVPSSTGTFSARVRLDPEDILVTVIATDAATNQGSASVPVAVDSTPPSLSLDPETIPATTAEPVIEVAGTASESGARIEIEGAAAAVVATSGTDGQFSVSLPLRLEQDNLFRATALDGAGNRSPPVEFEIRHDAAGPAIVAVRPADGSKDVDPDAIVQVTFSEEIDPLDVQSALLLSAGGGPVAGQPELSPGRTTVSFVPSAPLPPGALVAVEVSPGVRDDFGNVGGERRVATFRVRDAETVVAGTVVSATGGAVEGATIRLVDGEGSAESGPTGQFRLSGAPGGSQQLLVDGSTARLPEGERFGRILRDVEVRSGQVNFLVGAVVLTPIDDSAGQRVMASASPDSTDEMLTFDGELAGFELAILPGSATFPDGRSTGVVTATEIDPSFLPARLPDGSAPSLLLNLEPTGTRFDPPCGVRFPNKSDLPPGTEVTIFGFEGSTSDFDVQCSGVVCGELGEDEAGNPVYAEGCSAADRNAVKSLGRCVEHFSFLGFVPTEPVEDEAFGDAEAFLGGRVVDSSDPPQPVPGVTVDVGASGSVVRTDDDGRYTLPLPRRELFAVRVLALVPTGFDPETGPFAVFQSEVVSPAPSGTTQVPDIVVDRVFFSGGVQLVSRSGALVGADAETSYDENGALVSVDSSSLAGLRLFALPRTTDGSFSDEPIAEEGLCGVDPDDEATCPVTVSGDLGTFAIQLAGAREEADRAAGAVRPGDILRIVGYLPATGSIGWTDVVVPAAGETPPRIDLFLREPDVEVGVRRSFLDADGETRTEFIEPGGRLSNSDLYFEVLTRFTAGGSVPPAIEGIALDGRAVFASNIGDQSIRFPVRPGLRAEIVNLRAALPELADSIESLRRLSSGLIEIRSGRLTTLPLPLEPLGDARAASFGTSFDFSVANIYATGPDEFGQTTVVGERRAAASDEAVEIRNLRTGDLETTDASSEGQFEAALDAVVGDLLEVAFLGEDSALRRLTIEVPEGDARSTTVAGISCLDDPLVAKVGAGTALLRPVASLTNGTLSAIRGDPGNEYIVLDPTVATIDTDGRVVPLSPGSTPVEVQRAGIVGRCSVEVLPSDPLPLVVTSIDGVTAGGDPSIPFLGRPGGDLYIRGGPFPCEATDFELTLEGTALEIASCSSDLVVARLPADAVSGTLQIQGDGAKSIPIGVTVGSQPYVASVDPAPAHVGESITVDGDLLLAGGASASIELDDGQVVTAQGQEDRITFVLPSSTEARSFVVRTPNGASDPIGLVIAESIDLALSIPAPLAARAEDLEVSMGLISTQPLSGPTTTAEIARGVPTLVGLRTVADGAPVLLGISRNDLASTHVVSTFTTAKALVYLSTGLVLLGPAFSDISQFLDSSPAVSNIASAIEREYSIADANSLSEILDRPAFLADYAAGLRAFEEELKNNVDPQIPFSLTHLDAPFDWLNALADLVSPAAAQAAEVKQFPSFIASPIETVGEISVSEPRPSQQQVEVTNPQLRWVFARVRQLDGSAPGGSVLNDYFDPQSVIQPGAPLPDLLDVGEVLQFARALFLNAVDSKSLLAGSSTLAVSSGLTSGQCLAIDLVGAGLASGADDPCGSGLGSACWAHLAASGASVLQFGILPVLELLVGIEIQPDFLKNGALAQLGEAISRDSAVKNLIFNYVQLGFQQGLAATFSSADGFEALTNFLSLGIGITFDQTLAQITESLAGAAGSKALLFWSFVTESAAVASNFVRVVDAFVQSPAEETLTICPARPYLTGVETFQGNFPPRVGSACNPDRRVRIGAFHMPSNVDQYLSEANLPPQGRVATREVWLAESGALNLTVDENDESLDARLIRNGFLDEPFENRRAFVAFEAEGAAGSERVYRLGKVLEVVPPDPPEPAGGNAVLVVEVPEGAISGGILLGNFTGSDEKAEQILVGNPIGGYRGFVAGTWKPPIGIPQTETGLVDIPLFDAGGMPWSPAWEPGESCSERTILADSLPTIDANAKRAFSMTNPRAVAVAPDRDELYLVDAGVLSAVSTNTYLPLERAPPLPVERGRELRISPSGHTLLVVGGAIPTFVDTRSWKKVEVQTSGGLQDGVSGQDSWSADFSPDGRTAYVLYTSGGTYSSSVEATIRSYDVQEFVSSPGATPSQGSRTEVVAEKVVPAQFASDPIPVPYSLRAAPDGRVVVVYRGGTSKVVAGLGTSGGSAVWNPDLSFDQRVTVGGGVNAESDATQADGHIYPPPTNLSPKLFVNKDLLLQGPTDIAFFRPGVDVGSRRSLPGPLFGLVPMFYSGNVSLVAFETGALDNGAPVQIGRRLGATESGFGFEGDITLDPLCNDVPSFYPTNFLGLVTTVATTSCNVAFPGEDPSYQLILKGSLSFPRRIEISQNGEYAVVARTVDGTATAGYAGNLLVVRPEDAVSQVVAPSYSAPQDGYDLSDYPLGCMWEELGADRSVGAICAASSRTFNFPNPAEPGPNALNESHGDEPVYSLAGRQLDRPIDVALEPLIRVDRPAWGACWGGLGATVVADGGGRVFGSSTVESTVENVRFAVRGIDSTGIPSANSVVEGDLVPDASGRTWFGALSPAQIGAQLQQSEADLQIDVAADFKASVRDDGNSPRSATPAVRATRVRLDLTGPTVLQVSSGDVACTPQGVDSFDLQLDVERGQSQFDDRPDCSSIEFCTAQVRGVSSGDRAAPTLSGRIEASATPNAQGQYVDQCRFTGIPVARSRFGVVFEAIDAADNLDNREVQFFEPTLALDGSVRIGSGQLDSIQAGSVVLFEATATPPGGQFSITLPSVLQEIQNGRSSPEPDRELRSDGTTVPVRQRFLVSVIGQSPGSGEIVVRYQTPADALNCPAELVERLPITVVP